MSKILEKVLEFTGDKIYTNSTFLLKIKVERIKSYNLITEAEDNILLESGENLITEGDYYE